MSKEKKEATNKVTTKAKAKVKPLIELRRAETIAEIVELIRRACCLSYRRSTSMRRSKIDKTESFSILADDIAADLRLSVEVVLYSHMTRISITSLHEYDEEDNVWNQTSPVTSETRIENRRGQKKLQDLIKDLFERYSSYKSKSTFASMMFHREPDTDYATTDIMENWKIY